jgi:hypothetical protein
MAQPAGVAAALTTIICAFVLAGCGGDTNPTGLTTTTTAVSTTLQPPAPSTTSRVEGPQPLISGVLLDPGEYVTTLFEPTPLMYRIGRRHFLRPFQADRATGFQNQLNTTIFLQIPMARKRRHQCRAASCGLADIAVT